MDQAASLGKHNKHLSRSLAAASLLLTEAPPLFLLSVLQINIEQGQLNQLCLIVKYNEYC